MPSEVNETVSLLTRPDKMQPPVDHESSYTNNSMTLVWGEVPLTRSGSTPVTNYILYKDGRGANTSLVTNHTVPTIGLQTYNFSI